MTLLCGGNTSGPKPQVVETNIIAIAAIDAGLLAITPWLAPFAGLIDAFVWDATSQCATDPPAMPTSAQLSPVNAVGGILNPNYGSWLTAVNNLLLNYLWQQFCQCNVGSQPTFTYPPPPAATSIPISPSSASCFRATASGNGQSQSPADEQDLGIAMFPNGTVFNGIDAGHFVLLRLPSPPPNEIDITLTVTGTASGGHQIGTGFALWGAMTPPTLSSPFFESHSIPGQTSGTTVLKVSPINASAQWLQITLQDFVQPASGLTGTTTLEMFCGSSSSTPGQAAPCITDPAVLELLGEILSTVNSIYQGLPAKITSLSEGTAHGALSGSGEITLGAGAIAVKVSITTDNATLRTSAGDPTYLWSRGYIVPITPEGAHRELVRLVYNPQIYFLPPVTTRIGYFTGAGVTISITELRRGP